MRFLDIMRGRSILAAVALLAVAAAGCKGTANTTLTPSPANTTNTFSGSLTQGATNFHQFTVQTYGPVTVTLTAVGPLATMGLGAGIGIWDGSTCGASLSYTTAAKMGVAALNVDFTSGNYCLRVYDSGNIPTDWTVTYTVDILHP